MKLEFPGYSLDLSSPKVVGILNRTPDSFSDGGRYQHIDAAVERALRMQGQGAAMIDVGGESTRPGARPVSTDEELDRVLPVVERLGRELRIPVSIDTSNPEVMRQAVAAGAAMVNDVRALTRPGALDAVLELQVPVCLVHMRGEPATMQERPGYTDVVRDVREFLAARIDTCQSAGMGKEQIVLDPGFGFGKNLEHNLALFASLDCFSSMGHVVLIGVSRKSMIGALTGAGVDERIGGGIALATLAVLRGVHLVRTHDVLETVQALAIVREISEFEKQVGHG